MARSDISVRISPKAHDALRRLAELQKRTLRGTFELLVVEALAAERPNRPEPKRR